MLGICLQPFFQDCKFNSKACSLFMFNKACTKTVLQYCSISKFPVYAFEIYEVAIKK